jgi:hypothetical protein
MRYMVLGMHKSGTTLIARLLHHAGINMVEETSSSHYEEGNYYERVATYHINLELLNAEPDQLELHTLPRKLNINQELCLRIHSLIEELDSQHLDWGFKDPRTCLVYEAWRVAVGEHKIVVIFRPVHDLWHRFDYYGPKIWRKLTNCIRLVQRWCEYNHAILSILESTTMPFIVVSYPHFVQFDDEFNQFETFIGRPISDQRCPSDYKPQQSAWLFTLAIQIVRQLTGFNYYDIYHRLNTYRKSATHSGKLL